jgi:hypothetical protein
LTHEKQTENDLFVCPNESCKKAFSRPLKALDFQGGSGSVYEACPHCLTRVSSTDEKTDTQKNECDINASEIKTPCSHNLGYLCERVEKDQIPDECILCKDIIACMLKSLKG